MQRFTFCLPPPTVMINRRGMFHFLSLYSCFNPLSPSHIISFIYRLHIFLSIFHFPMISPSVSFLFSLTLPSISFHLSPSSLHISLSLFLLLMSPSLSLPLTLTLPSLSPPHISLSISSPSLPSPSHISLFSYLPFSLSPLS